MPRAPKAAGANQVPAWNPANLLTMLRIVLVPVFASLMLYHQPGWALLVYGLAAITDLVDGWLARRHGWVTALGIFIDPLADKLLQLTAVTLLAVQGHAAPWVAVLAWAREVVVVSGFAVLAMLGVSRQVRSSWWGKASTLIQMFALAFCLAVPAWGLGPPWTGLIAGVLGLAALLNFLSGMEYAWRGFQAFETAQRRRRAG
jgi:CDP-diacylglycerol--glycerol-3-phosphate 3-phosphatidyltransferase